MSRLLDPKSSLQWTLVLRLAKIIWVESRAGMRTPSKSATIGMTIIYDTPHGKSRSPAPRFLRVTDSFNVNPIRISNPKKPRAACAAHGYHTTTYSTTPVIAFTTIFQRAGHCTSRKTDVVMATTAISGYHSPFDSSRSTSFASSPLAPSTSRKQSTPASRPQPVRTSSFPPSRPLRPFASIAQSIAPPKRGSLTSNGKKPVKLIEQPKNHKGTFLLNLTQAELSRQD